jgi:hypothetical protein
MTRRESPRRTHRLPTGAAAYVFEEAAPGAARKTGSSRGCGPPDTAKPSCRRPTTSPPYLTHLSAREERELYRFVDRHA